jgi:membrane associated rhomboid family serine protease
LIPIGDDVPGERFPFLTYLLIGLNILVFLFQLSLPPEELRALIFTWGVIPRSLAAWGSDPLVLLTLVTSLFLHGGWFHLIGNMLYLWIFGNNVEDRMGHVGFLLFYLLCGIAASLTEVFLKPGSALPTIGASGAIAGVLGAYFLLYPRAKVILLVPVFLFFFFTVQVPAVVVLGLWFVLQLFSGVAQLGVYTESGGVAYWAHAGGFVAGMLLMPLFRCSRRSPLRYVYQCGSRKE